MISTHKAVAVVCADGKPMFQAKGYDDESDEPVNEGRDGGKAN